MRKVCVLKGEDIENKEKGFPRHGEEWLPLKTPLQRSLPQKSSAESSQLV